MPKIELWAPGFAVEFFLEDLKGKFLIRKNHREKLTLCGLISGQVITVSINDMNEYRRDEKVKFIAEHHDLNGMSFTELSDLDQMKTARKYHYVSAYFEKGAPPRSRKKLLPIIEEVSDSIGDKKPPAWNTLNNWINQYKKLGKKLRGIYSNTAGRGNRDDKIDDIVIEFIESQKPRYLKKSQPLASSILKIVEAKIIDNNFSNPEKTSRVPALATVKKRLNTVRYDEKIRGRIGAHRARYEFSKLIGSVETHSILERVEVDHSPLDLHLLDDDHGTLLGRPTLTVFIDYHSRMVVGFQVSYEAASYASASMALSCSILNKQDLLDKYGVNGEWPAHGIMQQIVADNGSEFWGENMDNAAAELGVSIFYTPVKAPNYKGVVERFFLTLKTMLLDSFPGKTNGVGKGSNEYNAQDHAAFTVTEFKKIFLNWLVNIYHRTPVGKMEKSPLDIWLESEECFPIPVEEENDIETKLMPSQERKLHRSGIAINNLEYESSVLRDLYARDGSVFFSIKYSPFDLGYVYVYDSLNKLFIKVQAKNFSYASGLSLYAHNQIRKVAKKHKDAYQEDIAMQKAKVEVYGAIEEKIESNKRRKNQVTTTKSSRMKKTGFEITGQEDLKRNNQIHNNINDTDDEEWEVL